MRSKGFLSFFAYFVLLGFAAVTLSCATPQTSKEALDATPPEFRPPLAQAADTGALVGVWKGSWIPKG